MLKEKQNLYLQIGEQIARNLSGDHYICHLLTKNSKMCILDMEDIIRKNFPEFYNMLPGAVQLGGFNLDDFENTKEEANNLRLVIISFVLTVDELPSMNRLVSSDDMLEDMYKNMVNNLTNGAKKDDYHLKNYL